MKAAVITRFGSRWSLEVRQVPKPVPAPGELLVRVHAATVSRTDLGELLHPLLQRLITRGQKRRAILGMDFAGEIEAVGAGVSRFKPGDRVFGLCPFGRNGAQAEYLCMPETGAIAILPAAIPSDAAPICEGAYYANASLTRFELGPGHALLIYGASGAIGTAAVQLAKSRGADVTAAVVTRHLGLAKSLGADRVVDCTSPEFLGLGNSFDFVLDAVGKMTIRQWRRLLKPDGVFATTDMGPWGQSLLALLWSMITRNGRVTIPVPKQGSARNFVESLGEEMAAGRYRAVVDRAYALDAIADAYAYVQTRQKAGIVVIDTQAR